MSCTRGHALTSGGSPSLPGACIDDGRGGFRRRGWRDVHWPPRRLRGNRRGDVICTDGEVFVSPPDGSEVISLSVEMTSSEFQGCPRIHPSRRKPLLSSVHLPGSRGLSPGIKMCAQGQGASFTTFLCCPASAWRAGMAFDGVGGSHGLDFDAQAGHFYSSRV